jgi:hypothetical protein
LLKIDFANLLLSSKLDTGEQIMIQKQLTENELVSELKDLGFEGVSKRTVARWRSEDLLPDFDVQGRGLGKAQGRAESAWTTPDLIIKQASWIQRMKSIGINSEDFHLYLWMLDFNIAPEIVRESLHDPLTAHLEMLEKEVKELHPRCDRTDHLVEDVISEAVLNMVFDIQRNFRSLDIPPEAFEAILNVFLNPEYDLMDYDFAQSFEAVEELEVMVSRFGDEVFGEDAGKTQKDNKQVNFLLGFLNNAEFFQETLSLRQLEKAVRECSDEVLAEVRADMRVCVKILMSLVHTFKSFLVYFQPKDEPLPVDDRFLPVLFNLGELIVLADISLRNKGYAEKINAARGHILEKIEEHFNEEVRKQFEEAAPVLGREFSQAFEMIESKILEHMATSPKFQLTANN